MSRLLRCIQLSGLSAAALHQAYQGIAAVRQASDPPVLLLATAAGHISLGAAQSAGVELDRERCAAAGIPVLHRALGGGSIWVDPGHLNWFWVQNSPGGADASRRLLEAQMLPALQATFGAFGLDTKWLGGQDLCLGDGRRVGGTGAATVANSLVLGGSFLLDGSWATFSECVVAPSSDYRDWLRQGMDAAVPHWSRLLPGKVPNGPELVSALQRALIANGWMLRDDLPTPAEEAAMAGIALEPLDWEAVGQRRVPWGIKLRHHHFLTERHWSEEHTWLRVLTQDGAFERVAGSVLPEELCHAMEGLTPSSVLLPTLMEGYLGNSAGLWMERLAALAYWQD